MAANHDYDGFWDTGRHGTGAGNTEPDAVCRLMLALWGCWAAYLAVWVASSWLELPEDGLVRMCGTVGIYKIFPMYLVGLLELYGGMLWALAGAGLMRAVCWIRLRIRGTAPAKRVPVIKTPARAAERAFLTLCGAGFLDALYVSYLWLAAMFGGTLSNPDAAGIEVAMMVFVGPLAAMACLLVCGFCFAMCIGSVPIMRYTVRWAAYAWNGGRA